MKCNNIFVWAPEARLYGVVDNLDADTERMVLFSAYREEPTLKPSLRGTAMVHIGFGTDTVAGHGFFLHITELPIHPLRSNVVILSSIDQMIANGRMIACNLGDRATSYPGAIRGLNRVGIAMNKPLKIDKWIVTDKLISLQGVQGVYYAGIFHDKEERQ